jgi:hypothetical protein
MPITIEAHGICKEGAAPKLRQVDAAGNADRHAQQTGETEDHARAGDGVCHAAARDAHRLRQLRKESQVQRARAFVNQVEKDRDQRRNHQNGARDGQA